MICTPKVRRFWRCIFLWVKQDEKTGDTRQNLRCVIMDMREHKLSYKETIRKYWEGSKGKEANYVKQIQLWERIFLEEGAEGLMKERRGKNNTSGKRGRPQKLNPKVEEDLIAENQRLRMEIEYLKKLSALVLAEEQKNGKKRS